MKKIETVTWDSLDERSIKRAEMKKARLENSGYNLFRDFGGLFRGRMIYVREEG